MGLNINSQVKSSISEDEVEDCLQVSCRWNYIKIVDILLTRGNYSKREVIDASRLTKSDEIKRLLNKYLRSKKSVKCCF
jgi:hypothetical protein